MVPHLLNIQCLKIPTQQVAEVRSAPVPEPHVAQDCVPLGVRASTSFALAALPFY